MVVPKAQNTSCAGGTSASFSKSTTKFCTFEWLIGTGLRTKAPTLAYSGEASKNCRQFEPTSPVLPAISADFGIGNLRSAAVEPEVFERFSGITLVTHRDRYYTTITWGLFC